MGTFKYIQPIKQFDVKGGMELKPAVEEAVGYATHNPNERVTLSYNLITLDIPSSPRKGDYDPVEEVMKAYESERPKKYIGRD